MLISSTGTLRLLAASLINSLLATLGGRPLLARRAFHFWMNGSFLCFLASVTPFCWLPINLNMHFLMECYETRMNTSQFTLKLKTATGKNDVFAQSIKERQMLKNCTGKSFKCSILTPIPCGRRDRGHRSPKGCPYSLPFPARPFLKSRKSHPRRPLLNALLKASVDRLAAASRPPKKHLRK